MALPTRWAIGQTGFGATSTGNTANTLNNPHALAFDPSGNLWVVDYSNNRVLEFPTANLITNGFASNVIGQVSFTTATSGTTANTLTGPRGVTFDPSNNLWVADTGNNRLGIPHREPNHRRLRKRGNRADRLRHRQLRHHRKHFT